MTDPFEITSGTKCQRCLVHGATVHWADSALSLVHGHYSLWCKCCAVKIQIEKAETAAASLANLREELREACSAESHQLFEGGRID